jgi:hypothetical protein
VRARVGLLALLGVLVACPAALAHGGGRPGYTSSVTGISPALSGLTVTVVDRDDRLRLQDTGDAEIVILGYDGEPYLRFTPEGTFRNIHSPATYLNEDRYANVELPPTADPDANPEWEQISAHPTFEWHDHRIHWMSPIDPPQIRTDPDTPRQVFTWTVDGTADGQPFTIDGSLDYAPPPSSPPWLFIALPLAALAIAGSGFGYLRRRKGTHPGLGRTTQG